MITPINHTTRDGYLEYYIKELAEAGFEVKINQDTIDGRVIVDVRKDDIMYRTSMDYEYFADDICSKHTIRKMVREVENAIIKKRRINHADD